MAKLIACPCGSNKPYAECCARYIEGGTPAPTAEALMRSRYTAYTLLNESYLLASWHPSTRPDSLGLADEAPTKWIGLDVKRHEQQDEAHAIVEFAARYKVNGKAHRLQEVSRFVREAGQWFYVDGEVG
ncbi:MAG: SEC-C domain-containing protein [Gammaproteobacteria bacterium]|nr:SEC-C domain-containing protein [Gammaproteobacteria bacterium]MBU1625571.1 SEC-C domain-containing protein [Gammaproteobacteria bacterium]MBU1980831.1 SEC-C domain-containing protein [Gammaproteobacteria bacterium]